MPKTCANCEEDLPAQRYHVHLSTSEVMEIVLCDACRYKFANAEWVDAVV